MSEEKRITSFAVENSDATPDAGPPEVAEVEAEDAAGPGIYELGKLPPGNFVTEDGLAELFGKSHRDSIKRAVARGELPPGAKICGKNCWTIGYLVRFFENRLESEARKVTRLRP